VTVNQNYFAKTPKLAEADPPVTGLASVDNGFAESGQGNLEIKGIAVANPQLPPPNPDDDATFLRFPGGPPTVGATRAGAN
jgi:hypothetical protein